MRKIQMFGTVFLLFLWAAGAVSAGGHGTQKPIKTGILLVAFGTSVHKAQVAFQNIDEKVKAAFPNIPVRWAYTSYMIRKKLAKQGRYLDSPEVALAKMMDERFTHVAIQSLHTILGKEFDALSTNAQHFADMTGGIEHLQVGKPLLASDADIKRVVDVITKSIPLERNPEDAVVLMGHGTAHPSNAFYAALMFRLQQTDPNIFIGTVDYFPKIDVIKKMLSLKKIKKAYLMPFMSVAGNHARKDMIGDRENSWKSILTEAGIQSVPVLKGTAEYDGFVNIWIDHLKQAMSRF